MNKPLIGLTANQDASHSPLSINPAYLDAVAAAGGIPIVLPYPLAKDHIKQLLATLDGLLLTGGGDIHPFSFGEETHRNCGGVFLPRDAAELALAAMADQCGLPMFGICRGAQIINVALGGDIYQDLPSQYSTEFPYPIAHRQPHSSSIPSHRVQVENDSLLAKITGQELLNVNSLHHQAIRRLAPGLEICAKAPDGVIEAVWKPESRFLLGVQWHPEHLYKEDEAHRKLFECFVKACAKNPSPM